MGQALQALLGMIEEYSVLARKIDLHPSTVFYYNRSMAAGIVVHRRIMFITLRTLSV